MIVPAVGGLASNLSESVSRGVSAQASGSVPAGSLSSTGLEGSVEGAGGAAGAGGVNGVEGIGGLEGAGGLQGPAGSGPGGFGSQLSSAISSLESTQQSADGAAQALATGTTANPESAVVTVEDAQMAMDLAAQIRTKATEAVQSVFQTQV
jgi:flagellar hook-basal body complex protein FliE